MYTLDNFKEYLVIKNNHNKLITFLTIITSIPIVIFLFVNYFQNCKNQKYRVDYDQSLNECFCQTFMTDTTLLDYIKSNGYILSNKRYLTESFIYVEKNSTQLEDFIATSEIEPFKNWNLISLSMHMPYSLWDNQMKSMHIYPLTFKNIDFGLAGTLRLNDLYDFVFYITKTLYNPGTGMFIKLDNGYYIYGTVTTPTSDTDIINLSDYLFNIRDAMLKDIGDNLFSIKPIKYCRPDYCLMTVCENNQNIYQMILLSISITATFYTVYKALIHSIRNSLSYSNNFYQEMDTV